MKPNRIFIFTILVICLTVVDSNAQSRAFSATQKLQGVTFMVSSPNKAGNNTVTIRTRGLKIKNDVFREKINGKVINAEVADLNVDGSPEIYVYVVSPDKKNSIVAYSANNKKSLSAIYLPEMTAEQMLGYNGGDEFAVVENTFARRFPIHASGGYKPKNKTRQIQYKLKAGEAGWILAVDKVIEY